ncbi:hypothetical protein LTR91_001209 [Friedmanniomyces endolithicus]|uniref:VOC domain-containing protein n=1 Tax=Friedmanniomyces endolithicus TaxID=329885 RepID=A0AAN6L1T5_9PEZI|nr:hypothetical protein LTR94_017629 [Friedmanniomyces endolithicus]KAK0794267.1 hypothetical protein LTR59_007913 [Friedmanniomyces endolithicus]KAK0811178.1 hypothetical protein LTR38_003784 [Friedmanniomyces endolithicus]KAK0839859.1 hypothetical protein LTR03_010945 [Friedmanniomyces endolithicus]KAK0858487.1 hypothetical protein LTS02_009827 [Friedmanniomyces endolithicus]
MPVSHLGLTVSEIPAATSFYLATLAPLGYRYIGQSGDSIGLGVEFADFFLTQHPRGQAVSPTHVAFTADSRLTVRNCYAAALTSGAHPSGAPSYRDRDCSVFNAAVEDLDGNVIEFVFRELVEAEEDKVPALLAPDDSRVTTWQKNVAKSGPHSEVESHSSHSLRYQRATSTPALKRSRTLPVNPIATTEFRSKAMLGTMLGASAGAAIAWAMMKSEGNSARDEAAFAATTRPRSATHQASATAGLQRQYSTTGSNISNTFRKLSVNDSSHVRKYPPRSLARHTGQARHALEQGPYYDENEVEDALSRNTSLRRPAVPQRNKTIDVVDYGAHSRTGRESHYSPKRIATVPFDGSATYYEATRQARSTTRHSTTSHRSNAQPVLAENAGMMGPPPKGSTSQHTTTSRQYPKQSTREEEQDLKRRDSGISMTSHQSHRSHRSRHSRTAEDRVSSASTLRPSRRGSSRHEAAPGMPFSASTAPSRVSTARPPSHAQSRAQSYATAAQVPIPDSQYTTARYAADSAEESDGLGDTGTVVPDDSISCVDFSTPRSSARSSHKSSKHGSRRSGTAGNDCTARSTRDRGNGRSAVALPARPREEYYGIDGKKRSTFTHE